jgi:hypothetical protein
VRHVELEICGESVQMPVNFEAGEALEKAGVDPYVIAVKTWSLIDPKTGAMREMPLTSRQVIEVLYIGTRQAGSKLTRKQIGDSVYASDMMKWLSAASDYLAAFTKAGPEYPVKDSGEEEAA